MTLQVSSNSTTTKIENGLEFILLHFNQDRLFPRKIQTSNSMGRQIEVFSKQEALFYFKESSFLDCRINAFPSYTEYHGIQRYPPDLIFIDIDKKDFKDNKSFENALSKTKRNIKEKLNGYPTINNSGNGYHILQPMKCPIILEQIEQFQKYKNNNNFFISQEFLRFAEGFLSNGKADPRHYPSFKSCQIRIPGSINGKCLENREKRLSGNIKVKTLQEWNGIRVPLTREFIEDFRTYLEQKITDQENNNNSSNINSSSYYKWIEQILQTPLEDCRKIIVDLILVPYLINIKKLSYEESYKIIREWLDKCDNLKNLDNYRNFNSRICYALKNARNKPHIGPMSQDKIKIDSNYRRLYLLIKQKDIL